MSRDALVAGELELVREAKVADLFREPAIDRFEASGVVIVADRFYVIFDNTSRIGVIDRALKKRDAGNELVAQHFADAAGYEDIAFDPVARRFFILVESRPRDRGFMAQVHELEEGLGFVESAWLPFRLESENKGLEGLTCAQRAGQPYLLAVCEGNLCRDGDAARRPGGGRIQVFARAAQGWRLVDTIALPTTLWFEDFSSLALAGDRLCVLSQESSALWVGRLERAAWRLRDDGVVYRFPPDSDGEAVYCNVEGVAWLSDTQVVVASDKAKPRTQHRRCRGKDESIHIFALPEQGR